VRLEEIGWSQVLQFHLEEIGRAELVAARVSRVDRGRARLLSGAGELVAPLTPDADVAVGDWCAVTPPDHHGTTSIEAVLPRRTCFARKASGRATAAQVAAANIDVVFVFTGLDADFSVRRIERLLTLTWESGATPVVVLNKSDACDTLEARRADVERVAPGLPVFAISALEGDGVGELTATIEPGQTIALLGSSGAGKSTLVNRLLGEAKLRTAQVRARDGRGQHTTTHRELLLLPAGGVLIDTPGMREVGLWATAESIDRTFEEIAELASSCRFADCSHETEPGCAVRVAVEAGTLDAARLQSFHDLRREVAATERRRNEHERRRHEKKTFGTYRRWAAVTRKRT
jgi:ribosome biogenesis GTPase